MFPSLRLVFSWVTCNIIYPFFIWGRGTLGTVMTVVGFVWNGLREMECILNWLYPSHLFCSRILIWRRRIYTYYYTLYLSRRFSFATLIWSDCERRLHYRWTWITKVSKLSSSLKDCWLGPTKFSCGIQYLPQTTNYRCISLS